MTGEGGSLERRGGHFLERRKGQRRRWLRRLRSRGERSGQAEDRVTVMVGGKPRGELDAGSPATQTSWPSISAPASPHPPPPTSPGPGVSPPEASEGAPPPGGPMPPPSAEAALQGTGTLALPEPCVRFTEGSISLTCLPSLHRLLCPAHTQ